MVVTTARKVFSFRPSHEVRERLERLSKETNRPASFYINSLLEEHLDELEHAYLLRREVELARSGKIKTYSLDEVKAELGIAESAL